MAGWVGGKVEGPGEHFRGSVRQGRLFISYRCLVVLTFVLVYWSIRLKGVKSNNCNDRTTVFERKIQSTASFFVPES